jgi:radical SAM protein with 4Fe4S-binding SPASM domain
VITRRFDLYRTKLHEQTITQPELNEILTYIRGSIKDMLALLENAAENTADEERFRKVERADVCRRCNFLKVCKPNI